MLRKIFRTGNSIVVSLPKDATDFLKLQKGDPVSVEIDRANREIVIKPAEDSWAEVGIDSEFAQQLQAFIDDYQPALKELAE